MLILLPTRRFSSVDFPTFGRPIRAIRPLRNGALIRVPPAARAPGPRPPARRCADCCPHRVPVDRGRKRCTPRQNSADAALPTLQVCYRQVSEVTVSEAILAAALSGLYGS